MLCKLIHAALAVCLPCSALCTLRAPSNVPWEEDELLFMEDTHGQHTVAAKGNDTGIKWGEFAAIGLESGCLQEMNNLPGAMSCRHRANMRSYKRIKEYNSTTGTSPQLLASDPAAHMRQLISVWQGTQQPVSGPDSVMLGRVLISHLPTRVAQYMHHM